MPLLLSFRDSCFGFADAMKSAPGAWGVAGVPTVSVFILLDAGCTAFEMRDMCDARSEDSFQDGTMRPHPPMRTESRWAIGEVVSELWSHAMAFLTSTYLQRAKHAQQKPRCSTATAIHVSTRLRLA